MKRLDLTYVTIVPLVGSYTWNRFCVSKHCFIWSDPSRVCILQPNQFCTFLFKL